AERPTQPRRAAGRGCRDRLDAPAAHRPRRHGDLQGQGEATSPLLEAVQAARRNFPIDLPRKVRSAVAPLSREADNETSAPGERAGAPAPASWSRATMFPRSRGTE